MFTGIVQAQVPVIQIDRKEGFSTLGLELPRLLTKKLQTGASLAVNGVCLTVTAIKGRVVKLDAIPQTLALTNLRLLEAGSLVNVERSFKQGDEVGGHILSGHVVGTAEVVQVVAGAEGHQLKLDCQAEWLKYVFEKGFLAVNGCSLTVAELNRKEGSIAINLIPETLSRTNLGQLQAGDLLNIEVDAQTQAIVETVERVLAEREQ